MGSEKYILLNFAKYLSFSEEQKNSKLLMFRSDFRKKGVCSKSVTKMLCQKKFLVSECIISNYIVIVRVAGYQTLVVHKRYH